jgi:hypothetical protein
MPTKLRTGTTPALVRYYYRHVKPGHFLLPGVIVEARFPHGGFSLRAMKLLYLMLAETRWSFASRIRRHTITLGKIRETAHLTIGEANALVMELREEKAAFPVEYTNQDRLKPPRTETAAFLGEAELSDGGPGGAAAIITYRFSDTLIRLMRADDRFTPLELSRVRSLRSAYAVRLLGIVSLRTLLTRPKETFTLSDLRARLGVERGTLERWADFRRIALDPAISEIGSSGDVRLGYEPVLSGRKVTEITLWWFREDPARRAPNAVTGAVSDAAAGGKAGNPGTT